MPQRSRKHAQVKVVQVFPGEGLDLSASPASIGANALTRAYNFWYHPAIQGISTRFGLQPYGVPVLEGGIDLLHYHVLPNGAAYILAVSGSKLWKLDGQVWEKVLDLQCFLPSVLSFNWILLVADGRDAGLIEVNLQTGETPKVIPGSPQKPTVLGSVADRVVCNSLSSPDAVFFSGPEQYDEWSTIDGAAALIVQAGFGDGMEINGFAALYNVLLVSKVQKNAMGDVIAKRLHMVSTAGTPASWFAAQVSATNAGAFQNAIISVADKAFFLDTDGPQSVAPSPGGAYGDIAIDAKMTPKIQAMAAPATSGASSVLVVFVKNLAQVWFMVRRGNSVKIFLAHPLRDNAWTELDFPVSLYALCETGEKILLGGADGVLYELSGVEGVDILGGSEGKAILVSTTLRTRRYENMGGDLLLRQIKANIFRMAPALVNIEAVSGANDERFLIRQVETAAIGTADQKIFDAETKITFSTWSIFGGNAIPKQYFDYKANVRKAEMCLQIRTTGGVIAVENIVAEFAVLR